MKTCIYCGCEFEPYVEHQVKCSSKECLKQHRLEASRKQRKKRQDKFKELGLKYTQLNLSCASGSFLDNKEVVETLLTIQEVNDNIIKSNDPEYTKVHYKENKEKIDNSCKEYYEENKEEIQQKRKEYYKNNPDKYEQRLLTTKKWREENKEYLKESCKKRWEENKEEMKKTNKEYRENNKDKIKARKKKWNEENKEKIKQQRKEYYIKNKK